MSRAREYGTPTHTPIPILDIIAPTTCHITDTTARGAGLT